MSKLTNYAACKHCVDWDKESMGRSENTRALAVPVAALFVMVFFVIFAFNTTFAVSYALLGVIIFLVWATRVDRSSLYLYYDQRGRWHAHRYNPISEYMTRSAWVKQGQKWIPNPQMSSEIEHISGVVIRLRWRRWLFRCNGYNRVFENRPRGSNWIIKNDYISYYNEGHKISYIVSNPLGRESMVVELSQLLGMINRFTDPAAWLSFHEAAAQDRESLGQTIVAVTSYLEATKRQGTSKVGENARRLLEAGLSQLTADAEESCGDWKHRAEDTLLQLKQIVAEADGQE